MKLRLLLATALAAALLLGGTAVPALADDFTAQASAEAYIPLQNAVDGIVTLRLKGAAEVRSVTGAIEPPGKAARAVTFDFKADGKTDGAAEQKITGRWPITGDDPAGDWKLRVAVARDGGTSTTPFVVKVSGKQGITAANVTPDPVKLVKGEDVKVTVEASVKDAAAVSAKLVRDGESFDLGDLAKEPDGRYRGVTYFGDDVAAGGWTLEIYARKGGQTLKGVAGFTVAAAAGGPTKKVRTRVTISAPGKVRKGRTFRVYGKVYRGSAAYPGKRIEVYFKAKGTKTANLLGFARTSSTGKYTKTYTARRAGYFRILVPGTSTTRGSLSPQELVDLK
ncbi:hypothetical protein [Nonomuraea sp. NPDC002799]